MNILFVAETQRETTAAAWRLLNQLKHEGVAAGSEAAAALEAFSRRLDVLLRRLVAQKLSDLDFARACESEREALAFNLAAIANERARAALQGLLANTLDFLAGIASAGLKAIGHGEHRP